MKGPGLSGQARGTLGGAPSLYHLLGKREQPSFLWTEL